MTPNGPVAIPPNRSLFGFRATAATAARDMLGAYNTGEDSAARQAESFFAGSTVQGNSDREIFAKQPSPAHEEAANRYSRS